jgi:hypothetical protein
VTLRVVDHSEDRTISLDQLVAAVSAALGIVLRTTMPATYTTDSLSPTVYYTGLDTAGNVITSRRTSGVTLSDGVYEYEQPCIGLTAFDAVWDEGDVNDYRKERVVVA